MREPFAHSPPVPWPAWIALALTLLGVGLACSQAKKRPSGPLSSASWLGLLPDGEEKRRFILDCTGCHPFDERIARGADGARTVADWRGAVSRMLRYAGAASSFPVMSAARDSDATAAWLARYVGRRLPAPSRARGPEGRAEIDEFPMPVDWESWADGRYPHSLALDRDGSMWFNGQFTTDPEPIDRLDPARGAARTWDLSRRPAPESAAGPVPYEIRIAPDGTVWGSELQGNRIFALPPSRDSFQVFEMPLPASGPRRFDIDADGVLWIPAYASNQLVKFDPVVGRFESFTLPIPDALPYVARADDVRGWVWVGTAAADAVLRFDPRARRFTVYPLPSHGAMVRHLAVDPRTHEVWLAYGASPGALTARIARLRPLP